MWYKTKILDLIQLSKYHFQRIKIKYTKGREILFHLLKFEKSVIHTFKYNPLFHH